MLVVDDIQWLDNGSLRVLSRVGGQVPDSAMLVVTTARNDPDSEPARRRFVHKLAEAPVERLDLAPLTTNEVGQLLAAHLGGRELDAWFIDRIAARASGSPFAVGEYVRALLDEGLLRPTATSWELDQARFQEIGRRPTWSSW